MSLTKHGHVCEKISVVIFGSQKNWVVTQTYPLCSLS
jgi:hypothetical protein